MNSDLYRVLSQPIEKYVVQFEKIYKETLNSDVNIINTIINYISRKKGKQLRPRLCLLSASLCGEPNEKTFRAAALIEMIHVATLIHDDVVDDADKRRGWPSVKRIWKNKLSILIGDYMFSKALTNMIHLKNFEALEVLSVTSERLSQGEISQIDQAIKKNITEENYYKMVSDKTASLFSASCKLGGLTVTEEKNKIESLYRFGEKFGLVFQIKDDLLDITGNIAGLGKPSGFDLKKNMLTLPLIYLFENLDEKSSKKIKRKLKYYIRKSDLKNIKYLVKEHGGIEFAENKIKTLSNEARKELDIFSSSDIKDALLFALDFNIKRNN